MDLCIDPGVSAKGGTGAALFSGTVLVAATLVRSNALTPLQRALDNARAVSEWSSGEAYGVRVEKLFVEWPRIYKTGPNAQKDPNHLLFLGALVGATASYFRASIHHLYEPRVWKGTLDGDAMCRRIEERLTLGERMRLDPGVPRSLRHNMLDAVGIGLYAYQRLDRKRALAT